MSEILFKVPCPAACCNDWELRIWYHSTCPSSSNYYLSDRGLLRCDYCGKEFDFFSRNWKSTSCNHDYQKSSLVRATNILSHYSMMNNVSGLFMCKLINSLSEQAKNYDL